MHSRRFLLAPLATGFLGLTLCFTGTGFAQTTPLKSKVELTAEGGVTFKTPSWSEKSTAGAGWATALSNAYMAALLLGTAVIRAREHGVRLRDVPLALDVSRIRRLLDLGLPAAGQLLVEVGVFVLATALAGRLAPSALAAHQVALIAASVTFMVPLGLSSAGAVPGWVPVSGGIATAGPAANGTSNSRTAASTASPSRRKAGWSTGSMGEKESGAGLQPAFESSGQVANLPHFLFHP